MLQVTNISTIYIASKPIDFRKGIDGIAAICRSQLIINPLNGAIFLFYNKQINSIKILTYDGQGFWLCSKRLSKGSFIWKSSLKQSTKNPLTVKKICYRMLHVLINNGNIDISFAKNWRDIPNSNY